MTCNDCGKTCHESKRAALAHIKNLAKRRHSPPSGGVYKCEHCGYFHITSSVPVILKKVKKEKQAIVRRTTIAEAQKRRDFTKYEVKISV